MSFTIKGIHPHDIATILDDDGGNKGRTPLLPNLTR